MVGRTEEWDEWASVTYSGTAVAFGQTKAVCWAAIYSISTSSAAVNLGLVGHHSGGGAGGSLHPSAQHVSPSSGWTQSSPQGFLQSYS